MTKSRWHEAKEDFLDVAFLTVFVLLFEFCDLVKRLFSAIVAVLRVFVSPDEYPGLVGHHRDEHENCWR